MRERFNSALQNESIDRSSKQKKFCRFKKSGIKYIDYKDPDFLKQFINDQGKILPRRITGTSLKYQKKIDNIIQSTSFSLLKQKEEKEGFREASKSSAFFREGKSMQWKNNLNENQISKIEDNFSEAMEKFNYK